MSNVLVQELLKALEEETAATRKCLERIPDNLFSYKPHPKSMTMGNIAFIVSDVPRWITRAIKSADLDFATYKHTEPKTTADLVKFFDEHMKSAKTALQNITDENLNENFQLKFHGQIVWEGSKLNNISSNIRHLAHHRGQLTIYMRMNDIPVPAIYGPSADEQGF